MLSDHLANLKGLVDEVELLRAKVKSLESREYLYETWLQHCVQQFGSNNKITRTQQDIADLRSGNYSTLVFGALEISLERQ